MPQRKLEFVSHVCLFKHWNYWVGFWKRCFLCLSDLQAYHSCHAVRGRVHTGQATCPSKGQRTLFGSICGVSCFCVFAECTASALQTNQLCSLNNKNIIIRGTKCSYLEWLLKNPYHHKEDFRYKLFLKSFSKAWQFQVNLQSSNLYRAKKKRNKSFF